MKSFSCSFRYLRQGALLFALLFSTSFVVAAVHPPEADAFVMRAKSWLGFGKKRLKRVNLDDGSSSSSDEGAARRDTTDQGNSQPQGRSASGSDAAWWGQQSWYGFKDLVSSTLTRSAGKRAATDVNGGVGTDADGGGHATSRTGDTLSPDSITLGDGGAESKDGENAHALGNLLETNLAAEARAKRRHFILLSLAVGIPVSLGGLGLLTYLLGSGINALVNDRSGADAFTDWSPKGSDDETAYPIPIIPKPTIDFSTSANDVTGSSAANFTGHVFPPEGKQDFDGWQFFFRVVDGKCADSSPAACESVAQSETVQPNGAGALVEGAFTGLKAGEEYKVQLVGKPAASSSNPAELVHSELFAFTTWQPLTATIEQQNFAHRGTQSFEVSVKQVVDTEHSREGEKCGLSYTVNDQTKNIPVTCGEPGETVMVPVSDSEFTPSSESTVRYEVTPAEAAAKGVSERAFQTATSPIINQPQVDGITTSNSVNASGCVDTFGSDSEVYFEWTSKTNDVSEPDWSQAQRSTNVGPSGSCGDTAQSYQLNITSLFPSTKYFVRLNAKYQTDPSTTFQPSNVATAETAAFTPPEAQTSSVQDLSQNSATVTAAITANNPFVKVWFEYGTQPDQLTTSSGIGDCSQTWSTSNILANQGCQGSDQYVSSQYGGVGSALKGLMPGVTYYYRVVGQTYTQVGGMPVGDPIVGAVQSFTTTSLSPTPVDPINDGGTGFEPTPPRPPLEILSRTAKLTVLTKSVQVNKKGAFALKVKCESLANTCKGIITVIAKNRKRVNSSKRAKSVTIAKAAYDLPKGKSAVLKLHLTSAGKKQLRSQRILHTILSAQTGISKSAVATTQNLTLKR